MTSPRGRRKIAASVCGAGRRWVDGAGIAGVVESFRKYLANPLSQEA
jgi:hypothetical protein